MEMLQDFGIEAIGLVQAGRTPLLDLIFIGLTLLGTEYFFLVFLPLILWCFSSRLGIRIGLLFLITAFSNTLLKLWLVQPRPSDFLPELMVFPASGYGMPSGHAQIPFVLFGAIYFDGANHPLKKILPPLILLIGFSRVYLGVHYPHDVLVGWCCGAVILYSYQKWRNLIDRLVIRMFTGRALFLVSFILVGGGLLGSDPTVRAILGVGAGSIGGYVFLRKKGNSLPVSGSIFRKVGAFSLGFFILLLIYFGGSKLFPDNEQRLYLLFHFLRYLLIGIWVGFGAPRLFDHLRWGNPDRGIDPIQPPKKFLPKSSIRV